MAWRLLPPLPSPPGDDWEKLRVDLVGPKSEMENSIQEIPKEKNEHRCRAVQLCDQGRAAPINSTSEPNG
jgi:hypothetical protein